ncbi:hypothetical protein BSR28_06785 [Boudabousia liubingyangii]|uniref:DUF5692 family protein n=1 Tax=Boudabousia liubingyangii TaxID=1921764 RepID=UPI00093919C5|nr:DUF5692 family protein [Boudabousia liubingyangii]OKL47104.1 hypothetical protein BSR28_06785 [Boudabousia liubingyangii]
MGVLTEIIPPDYPTYFFFEKGDWIDYLAFVLVVAGLAVTAWLIQRYNWAVILFFLVAPILLTIFWWPYSTEGTTTAGWFPVVKHYSALIGSLSLVALQLFPKLRKNYWYLCLPPILLAVNILEAVVRDFQCFWVEGADPNQGGMINWGGSWNIMNGIAGILNLLAISGWVGIFVAKGKSRAIIWPDLTLAWIVAYDLWNFAFVYNCISDHAWYSGLALLASCTIPVMFRFARGSWIQYRAYTLTLWTAFALTFPTFTNGTIFEHRSSHNPTALFLVSFASLVVNAGVIVWHVYRIKRYQRNPFTQEVYAGTKESEELARLWSEPKGREKKGMERKVRKVL